MTRPGPHRHREGDAGIVVDGQLRVVARGVPGTARTTGVVGVTAPPGAPSGQDCGGITPPRSFEEAEHGAAADVSGRAEGPATDTAEHHVLLEN